MLDEGSLSLVLHPGGGADAAEAKDWLVRLREAGVAVRVLAITDYELRRELLRAGRMKSAERLDRFWEEVGFLPITTEAMRLAAELWAEARNRGEPTAPDAALDADVVLAAQARLAGEGAVVATTNPGHLSRYMSAVHWREVVPHEEPSGEGATA